MVTWWIMRVKTCHGGLWWISADVARGVRMTILPMDMDIRPEWTGSGYAFVSMDTAQTRPDCSWVGHGYNIVPMDISKPDPIV